MSELVGGRVGVLVVATAMTNGDVASLDDSMVRRVIRKPFDIDAVAQALVETAEHIAAEQEASGEVIASSPGTEVVSVPVPSPQQPRAAEMDGAEEAPTPVAEPESEKAVPITDPPAE